MEKYKKDGMVAVLYTCSYGSGWYSCNKGNPDMVFDKDIVFAVLDDDYEAAEKIAKQKYPECHLSGVSYLDVDWVPEGCAFRIDEYDGKEEVIIIGHDLLVA